MRRLNGKFEERKEDAHLLVELADVVLSLVLHLDEDRVLLYLLSGRHGRWDGGEELRSGLIFMLARVCLT